MKTNRFLVFFLAVLLLYATVLIGVADADDDDRGKRYMPPVDNELYAGRCSLCHFLYLPGLLPSGSWIKIVEGAEDHFGLDLALDEETRTEIVNYLKANGAETTRAKRSVKIMKSLKGATPLRITETRYIVKKHDEIRSSVFERDSIGSLSNCIACHRTADKGIFDDDYVKIPRK